MNDLLKRKNEALTNLYYDYNKVTIPSSRLSARGLGETRLTNGCGNGVKCSDEEHQLNRRTEIEVRAFSEDGVIIQN